MTGKRIPYFRFYPSDFMRGVRGLTAQEVGVYTMLLCRMYEESGPIECHILRLSTYCGMREATFEKTLNKLVALGKINLANGMLSNGRAEIEISNRSNDLKIASAAGKASAEKRQQNQRVKPTTVQRKANHTDTDTEDRDTNVSLVLFAHDDVSKPDMFEDFWQQYPHRNGAKKGKAAAKAAWDRKIKAKASPKDIISGAMRYASDRQVISGYAKDPSTWLNQEGWMDDVEQSGNNGGSAGGPANQGTRRAGIGSGTTDAFAAVAERLSRM